MNEEQKKECRKLICDMFRMLSRMMEEDFEPETFSIFSSKKEALQNRMIFCNYRLRDLEKIVNSLRETNELDKVI